MNNNGGRNEIITELIVIK